MGIRTIGDHWFDLIHILPRFIDAGNVLSTTTYPIEIYNAFLYESHPIDSYINNAGDGTEIIDLPSLPYYIPAQRSLFLTLEMLATGAPTVDGDIVFGLDGGLGYDLHLPITATRLVVFPFVPEAPLQERLSFLTDIMRSKNGEEQRVSNRINPRQTFPLDFALDEGDDLTRFDILMFEWQSRIFGLPVWTEPTRLTADATIGDSTVAVASTNYADYRIGSLAVLWANDQVYDALEVASFDATSITFASPLPASYAAGTAVMPMRTVNVGAQISGSRRNVNLGFRSVEFRAVSNAVPSGFADASPFIVSGGPLDGQILLDTIHLGTGGSMREVHERDMLTMDNRTGKFSQVSTLPYNIRAFGFEVTLRGRESIWRFRRLLHHLRGRQVPFFLPTWYRDLRLASTWVNATDTVLIPNLGFARFALQRGRYKYIRTRLNDGTVLDREIIASAEVDSATDQIQLSANAPYNIEPGDVASIQFLERVRLDRDDITIVHLDNIGQARVAFPVRGLYG